MRRLALTSFMLLTAAGGPAAQSVEPAASPAMGVRYEDLQWQTIIPDLGSDSPQISILHVDPATKATHLMIRVPRQLHVPMHWHSANETHTVLRGQWTFEHQGMRHQLGPGGFNYIPAKMHHQAWASDDALVLITVDGAWDVNWVNGPPTKANLGVTPDATGGTAGTAPMSATPATAVRRTPLQTFDVPAGTYETLIAHAGIGPNADVARHTHPGPESGYVLEGSIMLFIEGRPPLALKAGDSYLVPAGDPQRTLGTGGRQGRRHLRHGEREAARVTRGGSVSASGLLW